MHKRTMKRVGVGAAIFFAIAVGAEFIAIGRDLLNMRSDGAVTLGAALVLVTVAAQIAGGYWLVTLWRDAAPKG